MTEVGNALYTDVIPIALDGGSELLNQKPLSFARFWDSIILVERISLNALH